MRTLRKRTLLGQALKSLVPADVVGLPVMLQLLASGLSPAVDA